MIKIYGKNCINEAIKAKSPIEKLYVLDEEYHKENSLRYLIDKSKINYELVNKKTIDKLCPNTHQGYFALREDYKIYNEADLESFIQNKGRILILDGIQDPHNLGAIIRSVDAFGFDLIILPKNRSASVNETVAHTSTGAIEYVNIMYVNSLPNICNKLKSLGYWIVSTDAKGDKEASDISEDLSLAIIIGSEGFGVSKTLLNLADFHLMIPMVGHVNSLNASVSAGIIIKEFLRR